MAATFPGGVKVFTTKQAGDQIASAHINDLQAEVVAIETELKKTTAATSVNAKDSAKVANTTPTAAGLALLSAADVPAQKQALGIKFTPMAKLADDAAVSITPPVSQGFFLIRKAGGSNGGALVAFDAVATPYTVLIAGTAIMAATTGALTGTTGTDGKITISAHSDGKLYIENRFGATIYLSYQVL